MTPGCPAELVPRDYTRDQDLPFRPDGNYSFISGSRVERVKRTSGSDGALYARKSLTITEGGSNDLEDAKRKLLVEAKALHRARHGHVVELVDVYFFKAEEDTICSIVMECADENLDKYLQGGKSPRQTLRLPKWIGCLVEVVCYVHGLGIRHRDIKPSNILVKDSRVLLADFGLSKMGLGKTMSTTIPEFARSRTPDYCAPEVEDGSTRGRSADIFSLGAVFLEMLLAHSYPSERPGLDDKLTSSGHRSYAKSIKQVHQFIDRIERELGPNEWFLKIISYCRRMLLEERDQRPLADELRSVWLDLQDSDLPLAPCTCSGIPDVSDESKLVSLCRNGSLEQVEMCLENGQNPNTLGAMHQASIRGRERVVQIFLKHGADVNLKGCSGQTALHCAAGYGHRDVVKMLLENEADIELQDNEGQTPLHCASGQGHQSVVEFLLDRAADIQAIDAEGRTALQFAARRGHIDVVRMLLDKGANVEAVDAKKRTALHFAAGYGSEKVVKLLLTVVNRDFIDAEDVDEQTALHFAVRGKQAGGNYKAVMNMLMQLSPMQV